MTAGRWSSVVAGRQKNPEEAVGGGFVSSSPHVRERKAGIGGRKLAGDGRSPDLIAGTLAAIGI